MSTRRYNIPAGKSATVHNAGTEPAEIYVGDPPELEHVLQPKKSHIIPPPPNNGAWNIKIANYSDCTVDIQ